MKKPIRWYGLRRSHTATEPVREYDHSGSARDQVRCCFYGIHRVMRLGQHNHDVCTADLMGSAYGLHFSDMPFRPILTERQTLAPNRRHALLIGIDKCQTMAGQSKPSTEVATHRSCSEENYLHRGAS